jgi:hypothetical protein
LKLNLAPHVPDDIVDSVLQQFQPALERPGSIDQELRLYGSLARKAQQGGNL